MGSVSRAAFDPIFYLHHCNVDRLWLRVRDAVVQALDSMTLEELAQPQPYHPAHPDPAPVVIRPQTERPTKESIAHP